MKSVKTDLRKLTVNVEGGDFLVFKEKAEDDGDTASRRLRVLIARDITTSEIARKAISVLGLLEKLCNKKVDTLRYRRIFETTELSEKEKEDTLSELENALSIKSREYSILKELIDESEFLELPTRGAYKPVILKTLAGLGIAYGKALDEWLDAVVG